MNRANAACLAAVLVLQALAVLFEANGIRHWNLAAAVLLLGFWCLPYRWWPALVITGFAAFLVYPTHATARIPAAVAALVPSVVGLAGAAVLRLSGVSPRAGATIRTMTVLHVAAMVAALSQTLIDLLQTLASGATVTYSGQALFQTAVERFVGTFTGVMLLAPALMAWFTRNMRERARGAVWRTLIPVFLIYVLCTFLARDNIAMSEVLRLLLLVSVIFLAIKEGWRGAVYALLATAVMVTLQVHLNPAAPATLDSHIFVAVVGAMGLLLGASTDEHRFRTRAMRRAELTYEALSMDLALAAEGNLHRELRERNRIARELHDEFGQNLTAVQTQLALLRDDFRALGRVNALESLHVITRGMRSNIGSVLEHLRPAALDELGLYGATQSGSIRRLAEDAGLRYDVHLSGDARWLALLNDTHKLAAYRLVQESITNVVRHAQATCCSIHFRINTRNEHLYLFVDVRDDGIGMRSTRRRGNGLLTMQHRVTALNGLLRIRNLKPGLRIHALFRQSLTG